MQVKGSPQQCQCQSCPRLGCGGGGISVPRGFGTPGAGRSLRSVAGAAATPGLTRDVGAQVAAGPEGREWRAGMGRPILFPFRRRRERSRSSRSPLGVPISPRNE